MEHHLKASQNLSEGIGSENHYMIFPSPQIRIDPNFHSTSYYNVRHTTHSF